MPSASLFAAAPWLLGADGHPSPTAVRVAHSEAECAGAGGQALRFSTQRQPPQFCELRRSSPDNSQCTPHSAGDRQVWSEPIRKTPAFPPTGPAGQLCGKKRFSLPPGATHSLFQEKREWGAHLRGGTAAKPPDFPGTPVPRDGRTPPRKNAGPVLTEELPRAPLSWRNAQKKSAAIPQVNGTAAVRQGAAFPGAAPGKQADSGDRGGNRGQEGFCPRGRNPACGGV